MSEKNEVLNRIRYLVGNDSIIAECGSTPALPTFSDEAVSFLGDLSGELLSVKGIRQHQDVISYAYWIRKASLKREKQNTSDVGIRIGRGMAFHIAPSNVPVNFAVSMTSSLLAGNITVIRVSNKEFDEVDIICKAINKLLEKPEHEVIKKHICIIRYDHCDEITEYLSSVCDVRIIWGGDNTIGEIRRFPIPSRAIEMCFADRYSLAVIDAKYYSVTVKDNSVGKENAEKIARKFYTDTYYSDQNACSSPRIVVWITGAVSRTELNECRDIFWSSLQKEADERYDMQPVQAIDKLSNFAELAMKIGGAELTNRQNNRLFVINIKEARSEAADYKTGGGFFLQYEAGTVEEIVPFLGKQCQTVAVLGIEKKDIVRLVRQYGVRGVDRVVDIGDTMGLEFVWDGYKMIESMSRVVYVFER